jgi:hypothetical protein
VNHSKLTQRCLGIAIVLVFMLLGYGTYKKVRADANMRQVRRLQQAMAAQSPEQRRETMQQLRAATEKLTPGQRRQLADDGRKRFEADMVTYTKLSKPEKAAHLDRQIDRMEQFRQNAPVNGVFASGPTRSTSGAPTRSAEERERLRRDRLDATTPEFRAAMDQFRKDMAARRQERGLPSGPGPRR